MTRMDPADRNAANENSRRILLLVPSQRAAAIGEARVDEIVRAFAPARVILRTPRTAAEMDAAFRDHAGVDAIAVGGCGGTRSRCTCPGTRARRRAFAPPRLTKRWTPGRERDRPAPHDAGGVAE
ncbi:hypothetical protein SAMN05216241_10187 [Limimonas halophila]|uniref:Uncharacterized protein n=1 Tax=Limimonas halophila TaxID=1082479 RepID=A0A1G7L2E3_9PROT|nr:hypothetical protein SAMN05216241_10187 [Limimonas halophila]